MTAAEAPTTDSAAGSKGDPTAKTQTTPADQSPAEGGSVGAGVKKDDELEPGWNPKLSGSSAFGALILAVLVYIAATFHQNAVANSINIAIVLLGLASGWLLGIMVSPYSKEEGDKINEYAKAFGVFASGYLVAKLDKVVEHMFSKDFIPEASNGFRLVAYLVALLIAMILTFVFRNYYR